MTNQPEPVTCPHCNHTAAPQRWYCAWCRVVDVCVKCKAVLFDNAKERKEGKQHAAAGK